MISKLQPYHFEYLRREDDTFFLGLKGPRGGIHSFPLTKEDMTRLLDEYFRARGAPPREEREASRQVAEETMRQAVKAASGDDSIPIEVVIAAYKGISLEEAKAWWEQKVAEAPARRATMLRTLPYRDRHQVIRLGREAAVLVPLATYRSLRELEHRVRPKIAALTDTVEAQTVGEWRAEQEGKIDGPSQNGKN